MEFVGDVNLERIQCWSYRKALIPLFVLTQIEPSFLYGHYQVYEVRFCGQIEQNLPKIQVNDE